MANSWFYGLIENKPLSKSQINTNSQTKNMTPPNLIKTGESDTVEFKEKFDERTIKSAVDFANTKGGMIFIGVSDKNNIMGITIGKETLNKWTNQISQSTDPRIIPELRRQIDSGLYMQTEVE
ncbi:MAG TPA: hypothetical protein C5S50_01600 [Methanosarcinaceae archaeon]|nr:hypothetical protein [Methanosarcinaceae archaeon]